MQDFKCAVARKRPINKYQQRNVSDSTFNKPIRKIVYSEKFSSPDDDVLHEVEIFHTISYG